MSKKINSIAYCMYSFPDYRLLAQLPNLSNPANCSSAGIKPTTCDTPTTCITRYITRPFQCGDNIVYIVSPSAHHCNFSSPQVDSSSSVSADPAHPSPMVHPSLLHQFHVGSRQPPNQRTPRLSGSKANEYRRQQDGGCCLQQTPERTFFRSMGAHSSRVS